MEDEQQTKDILNKYVEVLNSIILSEMKPSIFKYYIIHYHSQQNKFYISPEEYVFDTTTMLRNIYETNEYIKNELKSKIKTIIYTDYNECKLNCNELNLVLIKHIRNKEFNRLNELLYK